MTATYDYLEEEIVEDAFTFRESLRARWKEIKYTMSLLRKSPLFIFGFLIIMTLVLLALAAPLITPYAPREFDLNIRNQPPLTPDTRTTLVWTNFEDISSEFNFDVDQKVRTDVNDMNNDTLLDFIMGTGTSSVTGANASLQFYKNIGKGGDDNEWVYIEDYFNMSLPENISRITPTTGDINGDGVFDVMIGSNNGEIFLSINNGTPEEPVWTEFEQPTFYEKGKSNPINITFPGQANPTFVDYDNDTDLDLVVGSGVDPSINEFKIYVFINKGNSTHYKFELNPNMPENIIGQPLTLKNIYEGIISQPNSLRIQFTRVDNDTRDDMICLFDSGNFSYYNSYGIVVNPSFVEMNKDEPSVTFEYPEVTEEPYLEFQRFDFTNDSRGDIIVFKNDGTVGFNYQYLLVDGRFHILGTDEQGGDIFSRVIWALRTDFFLAIWIVFVALIIGTVIGGISGYFGGWIDNLMMRITDIFFAFPGLILAMSIAAALGPNLFNLSIALIIVWWSGYARIARGQVISEKNKLYVEAARSIGMSDMRILFRHILPNSIYPLLVAATLDLGGVVLTAAGLSFIGFGAQPGDAELGIMISSGRIFYLSAPWLVFFPGLFIFLIVLAFNLVGDGIRDVMDPKLRR
ncbi:MAG: ABC transporter permease subunit [Candidatus Hodarchaeales archaeon]